MKLTAEQYQEIGENLVARLLALNGRGPVSSESGAGPALGADSP